MPVAAILLAAGQGTRMNSDAAEGAAPARLGAADRPRPRRGAARSSPSASSSWSATAAPRSRPPPARLDEAVAVVTQAEQKGTGHAVLQALPALDGFAGDAIVLYGDTPLVRPGTLAAMLDARAAGADIVVLGFEAADPGRLRPAGRRRATATLEAIVEARDATPEERAITLCNSGILAADLATLRDAARRGPPRQRQGRILSDRRRRRSPAPAG